MSDIRDDNSDGPSAESIYDIGPAVDGPITFIPDGRTGYFRCDALRLLFRKVAQGEEPKFGFILSGMVSGEMLAFKAEWAHRPDGVQLTVIVPERETYTLGQGLYSRDRLKSILEAALTAYAASVDDLLHDWTKVRWNLWFRPEAPTASAASEPASGPEVAAPETAKVVPAKKKLLWGRWILFVVGGFFCFSVLSVAIHRFVPVPITFLMIERAIQGKGLDHRWVPASKISDNLKAAVIASEDQKFCTHDGFDVEAIKKAQKYNAKHKKKKRGASTISQQTAKNVFLWPSRSWVRKGFEVYYTFLIEHMWPKERILEVYLNSIEWAPGVYGAEAASQHWFHHSAATLTNAEAARLAAILPNPIKMKANAGKYVAKRSGSIQARARAVDNSGLDACAAD